MTVYTKDDFNLEMQHTGLTAFVTLFFRPEANPFRGRTDLKQSSAASVNEPYPRVKGVMLYV